MIRFLREGGREGGCVMCDERTREGRREEGRGGGIILES